MKLPDAILSCLRGPLVAATLTGCAPAPAEPPPPAPIEPVLEPAATPDAVGYDVEAERERLARLDRERAAEEHRRGRRIADADPPHPFGMLGGRRWIHPACGRG